MSSKRLSEYSDAYCKFCRNPAAEGLADGDGLWCKNCGRIRAVMAFEIAAFELLRTFPEDFDATLAGVRAFNGTPNLSHSSSLAEKWRPNRSARTWVTS